MTTPDAAPLTPSLTPDLVLLAFLGAELEVAAFPLPPRVPAFAAETVRPGASS